MTIFLKTLSSLDSVPNKMNLKMIQPACCRPKDESQHVNKGKQITFKRSSLSVTLVIVLLFPGLPIAFHSCVTQFIINPDAKIFQSVPCPNHDPLSLGVGTVPQMKCKGESQKEDYFFWEEKG